MGRFFSGLVRTGAWSCFDEFNRIDVEVLSVIAQQVFTIQQAMVSQVENFFFDGRNLSLNRDYGCFITMNPGYAGRSVLPENLNRLFRPVAMVLPDFSLIAEIMLFSEGFRNAKIFSGKIVNLYKLSSEQLSKQDHYDFGLRAIKSVLVAAGSLKRKHPAEDERTLIIRTLKDSNIPKFLAEDVPLFNALIQDLFPGSKIADADVRGLSQFVTAELTAQGLEPVPSFVQKIGQLYDTMTVRHGVMLVGSAGSGKTTCYKTLSRALTTMKRQLVNLPLVEEVKTYVVNPKAVSAEELYGHFSASSHEWTDGLISTIARKIVADDSQKRKWLVFDGPVDPIWIEDLNTLLDDNKMLCFANGKRLKLDNSVTILFEVENLAKASPATVSRCGMVYLEPVHLGWQAIVKSWLGRLQLESPSFLRVDELLPIVEKLVPSTLIFLKNECQEMVPLTECALVSSFLRLFESTFSFHRNLITVEARSCINLIMIFSYIWTFGGNLDENSQRKFNHFVRDSFSTLVPIPSEYTIFDYYVSVEEGMFYPWRKIVPAYVYEPTLPFYDVYVPTVDTFRMQYLIKMLSCRGYSVLLSGPMGIGKTTIVRNFLNQNLNEDQWTKHEHIFSYKTNCKDVQNLLESKWDRKSEANLAKKTVLFLDEFNTPECDAFGTQSPMELLRQCLDMGGIYELEKMSFKRIKSIQVVACCTAGDGGNPSVPTRLLRHFNVFSLSHPTVDSCVKIYTSIGQEYIKKVYPNFFHSQVGPIARATIDLYQAALEKLPPIPGNFHYAFTLRDVSYVYQGIMLAHPERVLKRKDLTELWIHETTRVFRDRLTTPQDRDWFNLKMEELLEKHFSLDWKSKDFKDIMFGCHWQREDEQYSRMPADLYLLDEILIDYLDDYNASIQGSRTESRMELVFFKDAIEHLFRIIRVLKNPRGHALLLGIEGTGRRSLTKIAAHMCGYQLFQFRTTQNYGISEFREDLKGVLSVAGLKNYPTVLLLFDTHMNNPLFLRDINSIILSGEVPDLFDKSDIEKITLQIQKTAPSTCQNKEDLWDYFRTCAKNNFHIIMCVSPIGSTFRERCRMFPSLLHCSIDWYDEWPDEALHSVAARVVQLFNVDLTSEGKKHSLCSLLVFMYKESKSLAERYYSEVQRRVYVTPTIFIDSVLTFLEVLTQQRRVIVAKLNRVTKGLNTIATANEAIKEMQLELKRLQPELEESFKGAEELSQKISRDQQRVDSVKQTVIEEKTAIAEIANNSQVLRDEAQASLDLAMPEYMNAIKALQSLNRGDIVEVRSFANPPKMVKIVMEAVCILKGLKPTWDEARRMLSEFNFLQSLEQYEKDNIPDAILGKVQKYIVDPEFQPEEVAKKSVAAKSLSMWVIAIYNYAQIYKVVKPKKDKLAETEEHLQKFQLKLREKQEEQTRVEMDINQLRVKHTQSVLDRERLEQKMMDTKLKIRRAEQVLQGLNDEHVRWQEETVVLTTDSDNILGNMAILSGYISYLGPFTLNFRKIILSRWLRRCLQLNIQVDQNFKLEKLIGDPIIIRDWVLMGLPPDPFSIEGALITAQSLKWPLLIDPQGQANKWIRQVERGSNLVVLRPSQPNFLRNFENAISAGATVLLENVGDHLDPVLNPILLRQTFRQGGRTLIRVGDNDVDFNADFKLYITTKNSNPVFSPDISIKVNILNFTVTPEGLVDQMLSMVVEIDRPDLESQKNEIITKISDDKKQLKEIERKLLKMLGHARGNLLENESLINALSESKRMSVLIGTRVRDSEKTASTIDSVREQYRPVAVRGSILYFSISQLPMLNIMYENSLESTLALFDRCIRNTPQIDSLSGRVQSLLTSLTEFIYSHICCGLFEKDKVLFAFLIVSQIGLKKGAITPADLNFFIRGGTGDDNLPENPAADWLSNETWSQLFQLEKLTSFNGLTQDVISDADLWREFSREFQPQHAPLPPPWNSKCGEFQRNLIAKIFHPDKGTILAKHLISSELGSQFLEITTSNLKQKMVEESSSHVPMVFVLSPGTDPTNFLLDFANSQKSQIEFISLGKDQGPMATKQIKKSAKDGKWICLQNCHLAVTFLPHLEKLISSLEKHEIHENFRLILTSMPSDVFPVEILHRSFKVTTEAPLGLKSNILRTYGNLSEILFEDCQHPFWKKLLFGLALFHGIIQERRKYGAIGYNGQYEWNSSDFETSLRMLTVQLEERQEELAWKKVKVPVADTIPLTTLTYFIGDITYGGKVTDAQDLKIVQSLLKRYLSADIINPKHFFTELGKHSYFPEDAKLNFYQSHIGSLPITDTPDTFGIHPNADILLQQRETDYLLTSSAILFPKILVSESVTDVNESVKNIIVEISAKIPGILERKTAHPSVFAKETSTDAMKPLGIFLSQEIRHYNALLNLISTSLFKLKMALAGQIVMTTELQEMFQQILYNQIPTIWKSKSYPSSKSLRNFVADLKLKVEYLRNWMTKGNPPYYWLAAYFFPNGFLTAVLQTFSRLNEVSLDVITFQVEIQDQPQILIGSQPPKGVRIGGLFMEGARWSMADGCIAESLPRETLSKMPMLELIPQEIDREVSKSVNHYHIPLYKTLARGKEICSIPLISTHPNDHWLRRGIALICDP
eukprot:TRINITY_DN5330_c1_g1_i1.p1 TRINITY_DN5330_c1_g1~~TRINITY_DN5330_c1_g1_i1.p1  ORF type:complete len:2639 (+),score=886.96 TRINITY_DN5330_c1_g1_i1:107-7918(+)